MSMHAGEHGRANKRTRVQSSLASCFWNFVINVERLDGKRVQAFSLKVVHLLFKDGSNFASHDSCHLPIKQGQWDIERQQLRPAEHDADCTVHNRVLFNLTFGCERNAAVVCRPPQGSEGGHDVVVSISLRDPRVMVQAVRLLYSQQECPRPARNIVINNLCAKSVLSECVDKTRFAPVSEQMRVEFGCVMEIFGASCSICVKSDLRTVLVKGGCDHREIRETLQHLCGSGAGDLMVHMLVLSGCLGVSVDVCMGCLLEKTVQFRYKDLLSVGARHEVMALCHAPRMFYAFY